MGFLSTYQTLLADTIVDPSGTISNPLSFLTTTFGMGVAVMSAWLGMLLRERASDKAEIRKLNSDMLSVQKEYSTELKDLLKDNQAAIPALIKIVEAVSPSVCNSNDHLRENFSAHVDALKLLIVTQAEALRTAIDNHE